MFSSDYSIVSDLQIADTFSTSDHSMVRFNTIVHHHDSYRTSPTVVYDFDNADYDSIAHYILNNPFLSSCPMSETVDQVWENFVKPLYDAIHLFVPTKVICTRSSKKAKWYPASYSPSTCQRTPTLEILPQKRVERGQKSI